MLAADHFAAAAVLRISPDFLQNSLSQAMSAGLSLDRCASGLALEPWWVLGWRLLRWTLALGSLGLALYMTRSRWTRFAVAFTLFFASLGVGIIENTGFYLPGMTSRWALMFMPWRQGAVTWNMQFIQVFTLYAVAGIVAGWLFSKAFPDACQSK